MCWEVEVSVEEYYMLCRGGGPIGSNYMTVTNKKVVKVLGSRGKWRGILYAV